VGDDMAKKGMHRPEPKRNKNEVKPVPELQGRAKAEHKKANPT
jgi:hypothetical protein